MYNQQQNQPYKELNVKVFRDPMTGRDIWNIQAVGFSQEEILSNLLGGNSSPVQITGTSVNPTDEKYSYPYSLPVNGVMSSLRTPLPASSNPNNEFVEIYPQSQPSFVEADEDDEALGAFADYIRNYKTPDTTRTVPRTYYPDQHVLTPIFKRVREFKK